MSAEPIVIDVISDVVCPWCYIGQRKLSAAIDAWREYGGAEVTVRWHPFELNPDLPPGGLPRADYVARKFGARAGQVYDRVAAAGRAVGLPLAFERIVRQPNTRRAHALIAAAGRHGLQDGVVEALFRAYFIDGRDLTDDAVLQAIATEAGLPPEDAAAALAQPERLSEVEAAESRAREMGVDAVPFFVFDGRIGVSGAQDPSILVEAMREATSAARRTGQ